MEVLLLTPASGLLSGWTAVPVGGVAVHNSGGSLCSVDVGIPRGVNSRVAMGAMWGC